MTEKEKQVLYRVIAMFVVAALPPIAFLIYAAYRIMENTK
jgi:hypothetical protein